MMHLIEMPELRGFTSLDGDDKRAVTSYSFWNTFRNCRKQCYYRYIDGLRPLDTPDALTQGDPIYIEQRKLCMRAIYLQYGMGGGPWIVMARNLSTGKARRLQHTPSFGDDRDAAAAWLAQFAKAKGWRRFARGGGGA